MIYNTQLKKVKKLSDCASCPYYDMNTGDCSGLNKICFEYDEKTQTIIDGITGLPLTKIKEN